LQNTKTTQLQRRNNTKPTNKTTKYNNAKWNWSLV